MYEFMKMNDGSNNTMNINLSKSNERGTWTAPHCDTGLMQCLMGATYAFGTVRCWGVFIPRYEGCLWWAWPGSADPVRERCCHGKVFS